MSQNPNDKEKPHDLREGLVGRIMPGGPESTQIHEPHQPHLVTPDVEEHIPGQTTHE